MTDAARALLQTKGQTEYRDCQISYYTYTMFEYPGSFKIGVNVYIQAEHNDLIKTLVLDKEFPSENAAIDFGVDEAKKYIDKYYTQVKNPALKSDSNLSN